MNKFDYVMKEVNKKKDSIAENTNKKNKNIYSVKDYHDESYTKVLKKKGLCNKNGILYSQLKREGNKDG